MRIGNVLGKAAKGLAHGAIGAIAFGLYTAANFWQPNTTDPTALVIWNMFGVSIGVGLSQGLGRLINYDPAKDPRIPK